MSWVEDALFNLIGLSDQTTVAYLLSLARNSKTEEHLKQRIFDD
jgi:hypothetical protein